MSKGGIGTFGAIALLVSSMTGPGLSTIPPLFQQSGWLAPMFVFVAIAILSAFSALFICEVLSSIKGNEKFQAKVEFTTVAQLILGKKYHYFFQLVLFLALQSVNVASIILAAQTIDSMLITLFKGTCGLGIAPGGWFCITERTVLGNSPFSADDYYIFTFGYLLTAVMVMPLGFFSLVENIMVQMTSFIVLCAVLLQWTVAFCQEGLDTSRLPAVGPDSTLVLGIVIFNYSYITTIPTLVNDLRPDVSIHKSLTISVIISTIMYIIIGVFGAMAYEMSPSSDILAILSTQGQTASLVTTYIFPICALVTSIPVFTIVIRQNLLRGNICGKPWAIFWANLLPWFICIPLQAKDYIGTIQNWSSLFFQSTVNFILPFILYFASRKYQASVVNEEKEKVPEQPTDVTMHYPEENRSISIRRSGRTSRLSRIEAASPRSPYNFRSPIAPKSPLGATPVIVLEDSVGPTSRIQVQNASSVPGSPNILKVPPENSPRPSTTTIGSPEGLGISTSRDHEETKQPERTSWISSHVSLKNKNNIHVPTSPVIQSSREDEKKDLSIVIEDEQEAETEHFLAFKPRRWLNPFYIAVVSSGLLGLSVVFMIIYDLAQLGMGNDIFA
ncbi:hypothetical protein BJV82DRAFT_609229 [Fennellomyces sp. T-0311]|nr:hypothetical protein BJV82DRAFT_609229 [Fennellomyces sp. T-0311]